MDMSQGHCSSLPSKREISAANFELRCAIAASTAPVHKPRTANQREVDAYTEWQGSTTTSVPLSEVIRNVHNVYNSNDCVYHVSASVEVSEEHIAYWDFGSCARIEDVTG